MAALACSALSPARRPPRPSASSIASPSPSTRSKVFENLVKKKFDKDVVIEDFEVTRFWPLDVEGAGHAGYEFYYTRESALPEGRQSRVQAGRAAR